MTWRPVGEALPAAGIEQRREIEPQVGMEDLGGAKVHCRKSGVGDLEVKDDAECIEAIKTYLSFFPHLVAGPIVRPGELIPQLDTPRDPRRVDTSRAFYLIATGLFKKIVVADNLSPMVDAVFAPAWQGKRDDWSLRSWPDPKKVDVT